MHQLLELSFDVPTIFPDTDSWENVIFMKLYAFEQCESNVKFFSKMVFGLLHQMLIWKMQNYLCALTTSSENIILCRAMKAHLFPIRFQFLGMRCSVESEKVKPSFLNWISEGERLFQKVIPCLILLDELSLVFVYSIWAQPDFLPKLELIRSENILSHVFLWRNIFFRSYFFSIAWQTFFLSKVFFEKAQSLTSYVDRVRKSEYIFRC